MLVLYCTIMFAKRHNSVVSALVRSNKAFFYKLIIGAHKYLSVYPTKELVSKPSAKLDLDVSEGRLTWLVYIIGKPGSIHSLVWARLYFTKFLMSVKHTYIHITYIRHF